MENVKNDKNTYLNEKDIKYIFNIFSIQKIWNDVFKM